MRMINKINTSFIGGFLVLIYDLVIYRIMSPFPELSTMQTLAGFVQQSIIYFTSGFFIVFFSLLLYEFLFGLPRKISDNYKEAIIHQEKIEGTNQSNK